MAIVNYCYYSNEYMGEPIAIADFPRFERRAEEIISNATRNQYFHLLNYYSAKGLTDAATALTSAYSNAICAQIEYLKASGILSATTGSSGDSFTVGKVTVNKGSNGSTFATRGAAMLSPLAQSYLEQTGLLGRIVGVPVEPFAPFPVGVF